MPSQTYLAVDIGAGSGRVIPATFDGKTIHLGEIHRFSNHGRQTSTGWNWNVSQLFSDLKSGLSAACRTHAKNLTSVAVDTWGIDYGLIDKAGRLLDAPRMYRDPRTDGLADEIARSIAPEELFRRTGVHPLPFNTIYQLASDLRDRPSMLRAADQLLFIPDLLTYWLSGQRVTERTNASTSQLLTAGAAAWDLELAASLGLPTHILHPTTEPATFVGALLPEVAAEIGGDLRVVTCGSHDTASAVAGVPSLDPHPLFLSSGTWSLIGREIPAPILTPKACRLGFSNEQGLSGTTRFTKNIAGMWLLQECKRAWDSAGAGVDYDYLVEQTRHRRIDSLIDPDDDAFQKPCDMPAAITAYLDRTAQTQPESPADMARIILQSLALKYRAVLADLRLLMNDLPDTLYVVGGGAQNVLLNQMTADATGRRVMAGPVEATAVGNVLAQLMAAGKIHSLAEGRRIIHDSFKPAVFEPGDAAPWNEMSARFSTLCPV